MLRLIGRASELSTVDAWFASGERLLTITGPPGVGKSRIAHEIVRRWPGSLICDLSTCRSAGDVERSVMRALGGVSRARFARALAAFEGVVVLDRFEQLVACARGLVEAWSGAAGPRFVVASREPVGLPGETVLTLAPLSPEDAVALYAERAKRRIDRAVVALLVEKLDRLPLAIELAAARASVCSDEEVLARIERGTVAIDDASSTLRTSIRWSMELLSAEERRTLLACAIFGGPFSGRAAEAIVDAAESIACLVALERKSLVHRTEAEGHVALYDCVREIALEELGREGLYDEMAGRHAAHYVRFAEAAIERRDPSAARALANETADLGAAYAFMAPRDPTSAAKLAIALDLALAGHAPLTTHVELLSSALALAVQANDLVLTAKLLAARAGAHRLLGATRRSTRDLRSALAASRKARRLDCEADVLRLLGVVARQLSRPRRARILLERALELYEAARHPAGVAVALDDLGVVAHDFGELALARDWYERALAAQHAVGDRRFEAITLGHLGLIAYDFGDLDSAGALYRDALAGHREVGDRRFEGFVLAFIAMLMLERGDLEEARASLASAAAIDARLGDLDSGALLAGIQCAIAAASGRIAEAKETMAGARADVARRDDGAARRMLDVFALAIELAEAQRARAEGRLDDERAHLGRVERARTDFVPRNVEDRLALRVVRRIHERDAAPVVAADGTWFESDGRRVSLATRRALAGMLAKLLAESQTAPGRSVSLDLLFEAGWPGERVPEAPARRRVYVGIDTLRSLGLRAVLLQKDRGYLLDSAVRVAV